MKETEAKFLEINPGEICRKLEELSAEKVYDGMIEAYYYDYPDRRLMKDGKICRLRVLDGKTTELTYKRRLSAVRYKVSEEINMEVKPELHNIFIDMGLECIRSYEKRRTSYVMGKCRFEIDQFPDIPPFLEIEADEMTIDKYMKIFGLSKPLPWTGSDVYAHYGKEIGKSFKKRSPIQ